MSKSKPAKKYKKQKTKVITKSPSLAMIFAEWWKEKHPVLRFLGKFLLLLAIFHAIRYTPFYLDSVQPALTSANAYISSIILNVLGQATTAKGASVHSSEFSMSIVHGCDATEAVMIFVSVVLAFPVSIYKRLVGALTGTLFLLIVNLIRVVSLFLIGVYFTEWFEFAHIEAWQFIFIMLALVTCAIWIRWAMSVNKTRSNA